MPSTLLSAVLFSAGQVSFVPPQCEVAVNPGESVTFQTTLVVPSFTTYEQVDAYFLADATGSMSPIIADVVDEVRDLASQAFFTFDGIDLMVGVGRYRDFPHDDFAFDHVLSPTDDLMAVSDAFDTWVAVGGADGSEAQLFALQQLATDPAVGFRPDAKRVVFWFGDAPGHDPICDAMSGAGFDVTEASATAALETGGPGGTVVLAASVDSGAFDAALDDDPAESAHDYATTCPIGGLPGQATRITAATDGAVVSTVPTQTSEALLTAFVQFLRRVRVTLEPDAELAPFIQSIEPPFYDVTVAASAGQALQLPFSVTLTSGNCIENVSEFSGKLVAHFDGAVADGQTKRVTVVQPECDTQCLLVAGLSAVDMPIELGLPGPADSLYVSPLLLVPVTMESLPGIPVPDDPDLLGLHVFTQVYLHNAFDFPTDPVKMSNGVEFTIGGGSRTYGQPSGMQCWPQAEAEPGGVVAVGFSIDGF